MTRIANVSTAQAANTTYRIIPPATYDPALLSADPPSPLLRTIVHNTSDNSATAKIILLTSQNLHQGTCASLMTSGDYGGKHKNLVCVVTTH